MMDKAAKHSPPDSHRTLGDATVNNQHTAGYAGPNYYRFHFHVNFIPGNVLFGNAGARFHREAPAKVLSHEPTTSSSRQQAFAAGTFSPSQPLC